MAKQDHDREPGPRLATPERLKPQLAMRLDDLSALGSVRLPEGYTADHFKAGQERDWERIIDASFERDAQGEFDRSMRADPSFREHRIWFVRCEDRPVATASAWHQARYPSSIGTLHMVGILPAHAGRGLGLQVSLAALHWMRREGRTAAVLQTDDHRLAAIKTYLKLGFQPQLIDENQRQRWRNIFQVIGRPDLLTRFAALLDGPVQE